MYVWLDAQAIIPLTSFIIPEGLTVRDYGALSSAASRARNAHVYMGEDLLTCAAYYAVGIAKSHPFVDGNKRAAWLTAATFLRTNGYRLRSGLDDVIHACMVRIASGEYQIEHARSAFEVMFQPPAQVP